MKYFLVNLLIFSLFFATLVLTDDVSVCGGFIEFPRDINPALKKEIDFSQIKVESYSKDMIVKEEVSVANSGYYLVVLEEDDDSMHLKVSGPNGMTFGALLTRARRILFGTERRPNAQGFVQFTHWLQIYWLQSRRSAQYFRFERRSC